jgi:undecaprenyl-diphosphatase
MTALFAALRVGEARLMRRWCPRGEGVGSAWLDLAAWLGGGWAYAAAAFTLWAASAPPRAVAAMVVAVLLANVVLVIAKRSFRRPRPDGGAVREYFAGDRFSFPSGHATNAFGVAVALALAVPPSVLPALFVASAIAAERIVRRAHYPSDVLAGVLVGGLAALVSAGMVGL